jgi:hypothetical protein
MDIKIISSIRGKNMLVVENYKFSFHKIIKSTNESLWKCVDRKCKCTIRTLGEPNSSNFVVTKSNRDHCHLANLVSLNRQMISASCKRKAVEDLAEKPAKIIKKPMKENLPSMITNTDPEYVRKNIYNARRKFFPLIPKSVGEVHRILSELDIKTDKGEVFLIINNDADNIVVFSYQTNLRILSSVTHINLDVSFVNFLPSMVLKMDIRYRFYFVCYRISEQKLIKKCLTQF